MSAAERLSDDELVDEIGALLDRHPAGEKAPYLGYIDGVLAGLLLLPEPVPAEEWLAWLGAGPDVEFADPADGERLARLLHHRKAEIAGELLQGGLVFAPFYDTDERGEPIWQIWLMGLAGVIAPRREHWQAAFEMEDEDAGAAMMGLMSLMTMLPGVAGALPGDEDLCDLDELAAEAPSLIPYFVETLYRRQRGLPRVVLADGFGDEEPSLPIRSSKIGRNDSCPCGSGKKFKKCCGR